MKLVVKLGYILLLVSLLNIFSCKESSDVEVVDKEVFIKLLADLHIADAVLTNKGLYDGKLKDTTLSYYSYILKKYDISRAEFDYSLEYYIQNSDEYLNMYDDVIALVESKIPEKLNENSIFKIFDLAYKNAEILSDLDKYYTSGGKELWKTKNKYTLPKDSTQKIELEQNFQYPCLFVFRADILFNSKDSLNNLNMKIVVDYEDSTKSIAEKNVFNKDKKWKRYQLLLKTDSSKKPLKFTASLLNKKDKKHFPNIEIKKISLKQYAPDKDTSKLPPLEVTNSKKNIKRNKKNLRKVK